jgi:hypothetical protein
MISLRGFCGLVICLAWAAEAQASYLAGVAVRDITPCTPGMPSCSPDGIVVLENDRQTPLSFMSGAGGNALPLALGPLPLSVRAVALQDDGGRSFVIITLDTLDVSATFTRDVRYELGQRRQLWPSQVMINASHTHNSPSLSWYHGLQGLGERPPVTAYVEAVKLRAIEAAETALLNMVPVTLEFVRGTTDIASWRRATDVSSSTGPDTAKHSNNSFATRFPAPLDVLIAEPIAPSTGTRVVLFSTACHSTGMYGAGQLSPDFAGHARARIEQDIPGTTALFVQGFGGDKEPYLNEIGGYTQQTRTVETGQRLGQHVVALVNGAANQLSGPLRSKFRTFPLAIDPSGVARPNYGTQFLQVEAQMLQIGDDPSLSSSWALLASAHEVVAEYEAPVRAALSSHTQLTLAGFTNAVESYIPTRRMIDYDNAGGGQYCGFLYGGRYEGCGAFHSYYLGRPNWQDSDYLNGLIALAADPFPSVSAPLSFSVQDDFNDNVRNDQLWNTYMLTNLTNNVVVHESAVRVSERGSALELVPLANSGGFRYNGYVLNKPYNLTGRRASIEVVRTANPGATSEMIFSVSANGTNHYRLVIQNGVIRADETLDSAPPFGPAQQAQTSNSWVPIAPFNAVTHRYLSVRHAPGTDDIVWEASTNRIQWSELRRTRRKMAIQSVRVELFAGTYTAVASPGIAIFDNFILD